MIDNKNKDDGRANVWRKEKQGKRQRNIPWETVLYAVGATVLVLIIVGALLYAFREPIVSHFTNGTIAQNSNDAQNGIPGKTYTSSQESRVTDVVKHALPSVVSVVISKEVPVYERHFERYDPFGGFGSGFLVPQIEQNGTKKQEIGGGSGFIVTKDGLVVTNKHVVADTDASYTIITNDGKTHDAKVIARDPFLDVAFLRIEGGGSYEPLMLGDSSKLALGQTVIAIGNVLAEFHNSVSVGVISGLSRSIVATGEGSSEKLNQVIQTDAAINPGNSGGPLLNLSGKVIGINVAVAEGTQSIGFSIPSNVIKDSVQSVEKSGEIVHPFLGVRYIPVTKALQKKNGLSVDYGALVIGGGPGSNALAVVPGSPADKAGIVQNDIILSVDGEKVTAGTPLGMIVRKKKVGQTITLLVLHDGKQVTRNVTLTQVPTGLE